MYGDMYYVLYIDDEMVCYEKEMKDLQGIITYYERLGKEEEIRISFEQVS